MLKTLLLTTVAFVAYCEASVRYIERPVGSSRIINGIEATPGEFPHQVSLLQVVSGQGYHTCGGSVIADGWVLTAGHCVDGQNAANLAVVVDMHDFGNPGNYIWFNIDQVIMHEQYNSGQGTYSNDIALLKLQPNGKDITNNKIKLASGFEDYAGMTCTISGWGTLVDGSSATILNKADVLVLSRSECTVKNYWSSTNVLDQHVCVKGYDGVDGAGACNGDSGGPLVCNDVLVGATSWGLSGCHTDGTVTKPCVYARISYFYNWINSSCSNCAV